MKTQNEPIMYGERKVQGKITNDFFDPTKNTYASICRSYRVQNLPLPNQLIDESLKSLRLRQEQPELIQAPHEILKLSPEEQLKYWNEKMGRELEELFENGDMRRPADPQDPHEPANWQVQMLLDEFNSYNKQLASQGEIILDSLKDFFDEIYFPQVLIRKN